ncbi:MAG: VIT1/CCC1 transporter family protein [Georgenia sp.]
MSGPSPRVSHGYEARGAPQADPSQVADGHRHEHPTPEPAKLGQRLNGLRAGVLGANDGIVSTAAVVVGVAGATPSTPAILTAGLAAVIGGAVSMALGEYVSVSSQRDAEQSLVAREREALAENPERELDALAQIYEDRGLSPATAHQVAAEFTDRDALGAHLHAKLNLDADDVASPWVAAVASAVAFTIGAILPMLAILLPPEAVRIPITFAATLVALAITGTTAAWIGGGSHLRAATRVVVGGALALAATYLVGTLLGTTGIV